MARVPETASNPEWLHAGRVGAPHGLDGSFHVADGNPTLLNAAAAVRVGGVERTIERRAGHDRRPILRLSGCSTRSAAESLRGVELLVDRALAPGLEPDEWWAEDLEGLSVRDGQVHVGTVSRLLALPSCEVLEVTRAATPTAPPLLVPLVSDAVRLVDLEAGEVDVDLVFLGEA